MNLRLSIIALLILTSICFKIEKATAQNSSQLEEKTMPCQLLEGITEREFSIYLPKEYGQDTLKRYPVLYLMHGGGESNTVWQQWGHLRHVQTA